jgi:hypothetical protein
MPLILFAAWILVAAVLSAAEPFSLERAYVVPLTILGLLALLLLVWRRVASLRDFIARVDPRALVALHIVRAPIGAAFLLMHARGQLPADFAYRGGIGDLVAGLLALLVVVLPLRPRLLAAFNVIGLVDLVVTILTAQRHILFGDPSVMAALLGFPFAMLPLLVVPLMLGTHVMLFTRLRG